jgi:hypothetical protein
MAAILILIVLLLAIIAGRLLQHRSWLATATSMLLLLGVVAFVAWNLAGVERSYQTSSTEHVLNSLAELARRNPAAAGEELAAIQADLRADESITTLLANASRRIQQRSD